MPKTQKNSLPFALVSTVPARLVFIVLLFLPLVFSCSKFRLDSEKNCLNQQSACFKWDRTDPKYVSATPTPNTPRSTLATVTLVFSEDLKNGEDKSAYVLKGTGATGLSIASVQKIASFTYQVNINGSILTSNPIDLDFSGLKDYSNNFVSGQTTVSYTGDVNVGVTGSVNHKGITFTGGYSSITVDFQHNFTTDPENTWQISVTSGVVYCGAGVTVQSSPNGVYLAAGINQTSAPIQVTSSLQPFGNNVALEPIPIIYRVIVCVKNRNNASVQNLMSWQVIRDDSPPTSSAIPVSDSYGAAKDFILTCGDNIEWMAYNAISGTSNPGVPAYPTFNASTGAITSGTQYTGPVNFSNSLGNSTYTNIAWRCIDEAGHVDTAATPINLVIDTTIPVVTLTPTGAYHAYVSNTAGGYTSTAFDFITNQASRPYRIASGATLCSPSGGGTSIIGVGPFTSNAAVNGPNGPHVVPATTFSVGTTQVRICVQHPVVPTTWGADSVIITRDDTAPVFTAGLATLVNPGDGTITLGWSPASDSSPIQAYEICQSTTAGACTGGGFTATYQIAGPATSYQVTGLSAATTYYFVVRARDMAGNRESNNVEKKSRITLFVAVTGYSSATPDFRVTEGASTLGFTSNITQSFSNVYTSGQAYSISVVNQPGGQNCAFKENQFGNIFADTTLNVTCTNGYLSAGAISANPPAKLGYKLYQGKNATVAGNSGTPGSANGTGAAATFNSPHSLTHLNGSLYVSDTNNLLIRRVVTSSNAVTTIAGSGAGAVGTTADDGACLSAKLGQPLGLTTDGTNLFVADYTFGRIRKLSDVAGTCQATTFAGTGTPGFADGPASTAQFNQPRQIVINRDYLFVADQTNNRIRRVALATGVVDTLAGNGTPSDIPGTGTGASLNAPEALTLISNTLYVSTASNRIMSINITTGVVSIVAGSGTSGYVDAAGTAARFSGITSLTTDGYDLYVSEISNQLIRRIELLQGNRVTTLAGGPGLAADTTSTGPIARFNVPYGLTTDGRLLYVANRGAHTVRKLSDNGMVGFWPLSSGSLLGYASDAAATNLTANGAPATTIGRYNDAGGAYAVNGSSQYFNGTVPITAASACSVTMAAWVKFNTLTGSQTVVYNGNSGSSGFGLVLNPVNGLQILFGGNASYPTTGGFFPPVNQWTHVVARCVPGVSTIWSIYVNGHKVSEITGVGPTAAVPLGFTVARDTPAATAYLNGSIADVRVYNRALGEGEINELAQDATQSQVGPGFNGRATGLLAHYEFSSGATTLPSGAIGGTVAATGAPTIGLGKDGDSNGAFTYSGAGQYYSAASQIGLPAGDHSRTLCAWVKPSAYPIATSQSFFSYGNNGGSGTCTNFGMQDNAGTQVIIFGSCGFTAAEYTNAAYTLPLNTWSHVCGSLAPGNVVSIYVNGSLHTSTSGVATNWVTDTSVNALRIGAFVNGTLNFPGAIDDVRIYNTALSTFQIRQLATQVPAGLVARYDFTGDRNDISGFGQDLNNNGAVLDIDRFGLATASARFASNAYFDGPMTNLPLGNNPRTICAWTNPNTLFNGTFSEVVMYGTSGSGTGWGFGMDAGGGLPNGRIFILNTVIDQIWARPHGLNIWRHICASHDGTTETLYVDGFLVTNTARTLSTATGQLTIGLGIFGPGDYFNGNIDDVRIYNRALSTAEIQALQQQPNKRIYVTANAYNGSLDSNGGVVGAPTGATGIAGADAKCNWASDVSKPSTGVYKAMIVDGVNRRACNGINCSPGGIADNIDWVLRSNLTYVRSNNITPIFTTNFNTIFPLGTATNSIITGLASTWTGLSTGWQVANAGSDLDCADWTTPLVGQTAAAGRTDVPTSSLLYNGSQTCNNSYLLYCVEQ